MVAYLTTQRWTRQFAVFLLPSRFASLRLTLRTVGAVEAAVLDGFGDVFGLDRVGTFEVGDGASDFQDAVVVAFCRACGGSDPIGCGAGLAGTRMRFAWMCLQYAVGDPAGCDGCHTAGCGGNGRAHSNLDGRWQSPKLQAAVKNPVSLPLTGPPRRLSPHISRGCLSMSASQTVLTWASPQLRYYPFRSEIRDS